MNHFLKRLLQLQGRFKFCHNQLRKVNTLGVGIKYLEQSSIPEDYTYG